MLESFCPARKTLPDRASVHTQKMVGEGGGGLISVTGRSYGPALKRRVLLELGERYCPYMGYIGLVYTHSVILVI